jgi:hypothetical protein
MYNECEPTKYLREESTMADGLKKDIKEEEKKYDIEFINFFDDLIQKGKVEKEEEIIPGMKVKLSPLDTNAQIAAEMVQIANNPYVPVDTIEKIRAISILSKAIVAINGASIVKENATTEENDARRKALYNKLFDLPSHVIDKAYNLYVEAIEQQKKIYGDVPKLEGNIRNF